MLLDIPLKVVGVGVVVGENDSFFGEAALAAVVDQSAALAMQTLTHDAHNDAGHERHE